MAQQEIPVMTSPKLPYQVQCKSTYPFFETIAAFDSERVAFAYASECAGYNLKFDYQMAKGRRILANADACRHMGVRKLQGFAR
jgi:hypothetical protein